MPLYCHVKILLLVILRYNPGMLLLLKDVIDRPVNDLRTGQVTGYCLGPLLDPKKLQAVGFWCKLSGQKKPKILLLQDNREFNKKGFFVDDQTALSDPEELVRFSGLIKADFELLGKKVKSELRNIGKVEDYCFNENFFVQKLYVSQPLIKSLVNSSLIIDRRQVIDVKPSYILVDEALIKGSENSKLLARPQSV